MKKSLLLILFLSFFIHNSIAQDSCAAAATITAGPTYVVPGIDGAGPPNSCIGGTVATMAEWYSYTPTADYTVTITTDLVVNTGRDTRVQVYTGTCGALNCEGGDDDSGSALLSTYTFNVTNGTTYYFAFDNRWEANGFSFTLSEAAIVVDPIEFSQQSITTTGNYRNCVVDMNGDFLDDIVTVDATNLNIHYQQAGGGFTEVNIPTTSANHVPSWSIAAGDFDRNGYNDLLYGGGGGVTFMRANADGTAFTEISGPEYVFSQRSNFIDINNDGNLDAFVCHDVDPNVYYLNDGSGNLVFNQGGLGDAPSGGNYASLWVDYDNDRDVDLFISKCNGGGAAASARYNELHRNNGDGTYTDVSVASGLYDPIQTWSSAWGDFDNNGYQDVFVGASSFVDGHHKFMRNNGDGTFTDITSGSGFDAFNGTSIEHITHDFDNDGYLDVFTAGTTIMHNNQDMTFSPVDVGLSVGAVGDLNNDGFLDVFNSNGNIYLNDGNSNNWIKINTIGVQSNINGIGARVEVHTTNLGTQIRDVRSGDGFRHMSSLTTHFGLGTETDIIKIVIYWPSGIVDEVLNPNINETHNITEGITLSTTDYTLDSTIIYPNPSKDYLFINNVDLRNVTALIFDINGKRIYNFSVEENNSLNIKNLATGNYLLLLQEGDKLYRHKFVKN